MKVLITGANGQVGRSLQARVPAGIELVALNSQELNITSEASIAQAFNVYKPDVLINAAAYTAVDKAEVEEDAARAVNALGPKLLAETCNKNGAFFVHISTDYVFDGEASLPYKETDPINPINAYGRSKAEGEQAVMRSDVQFAILRTSWVFSEYGKNFLKTMLQLGAQKARLNIVSDQMGAPTYAGHIAEAIFTIIKKRDKIEHEIFHFSGNHITSWMDFAKYIFKIAYESGKLKNRVFVKGITSDEYPTASKRPKNSVMDCKKIKDLCGINASDWQAAVKEVVENI